MDREVIKKELDKIIDEGSLGNLREKVIDYIEELLERQAEDSYDRYYGINQEDEMTKGCDQYHAEKDKESEREAIR